MHPESASPSDASRDILAHAIQLVLRLLASDIHVRDLWPQPNARVKGCGASRLVVGVGKNSLELEDTTVQPECVWEVDMEGIM